MKNILTSALVLIGICLVGWLGYIYYLEYQNQVRNQAVDGCMHAARYVWQAPNPQSPDLFVTNDEPHRFWYKTCMEEKGYLLNIEI